MAKYTGISADIPDIDTVWTDKQSYPYAVIIQESINPAYYLLISSTPFNAEPDNYGGASLTSKEGYAQFVSKYSSGVGYGSWEHDEADDYFYRNDFLEMWTSHDILCNDGTLYLAASDPVPVGGEPETLPLYYSKGGVWRRLFRKVNGAWEEVDGVFGLTPEVRELKELHDSLGVVEPFIYFTDPHLCEGVGWQPRFHEYMAKVKQVYDNSPCKLVICGGDWIGNSDTKEQATYKLSYVADYMRRLFGNNHMLVLGNHDTNYQGTEQLTQQELIDLWYKDTNTGKAYYYHDTQTTRFLVLDTQTDWNPEWSEYFQEQRDWLAANLSAELKNVVVVHIDWVVSDLTTRTSLVDVIQYVDGVDMILAGHIHADHVNYGVVPEVVTTNLQAGDTPTFDLCLLDVENNQLHMVRVGTGENRTINLGGAS